MWRNSKELHEFNLPNSVSQNGNFIPNLKKIVLENLESKSLRLAKAKIVKQICEPESPKIQEKANCTLKLEEVSTKIKACQSED